MSKLSLIERELKKIKTAKRFEKKRGDLKEKIRKAYLQDDGSAWELLEELQKMPRNSSKCRIQRRCSSCGRPRAVYRKFGLCRLCLRKYAMQGYVPGLEKSSW